MNSDTHRGWRGLGTISLDTERQLWSARTAHGLRKALVSTYWFITKDNIGANPDEKDTRAGMGGAGTFMSSSGRSLSHLHVFLFSGGL